MRFILKQTADTRIGIRQVSIFVEDVTPFAVSTQMPIRYNSLPVYEEFPDNTLILPHFSVIKLDENKKKYVST